MKQNIPDIQPLYLNKESKKILFTHETESEECILDNYISKQELSKWLEDNNVMWADGSYTADIWELKSHFNI